MLGGNQLPAHHVVSILQSSRYGPGTALGMSYGDCCSFCSVEQLSLKCCCLGDAFCAAISSTLATNRSLMALDLSSNQITDQGVVQLAHALRLNRTLLSLCLTGNRIGDSGVEAICKVYIPVKRQTGLSVYVCLAV